MESNALANALAFYSPVIIAASVFIFSLFASAIGKGAFYIFWLIIAIMIRIVFLWSMGTVKNLFPSVNPVCDMGNLLPYQSLTYSTFVLSFTFFYFTMPMYITGNINYLVLMFFIIYMIFDLSVKSINRCSLSVFSVVGDLLAGGALGAFITSILFSSPMSNWLFINETNDDGEVCSVPSKQSFRCSVYKNGQLVSSSLQS